ncbi:MAG: metallophosphoesterase [Gemmatimonadetes bacterium]|nr:metallophosphoesterase [Gemmatimonadota bacterium]
MILAHLADLHLGYRAYHRLVAGSDERIRYNARERDVSLAFRAALDRVIDLRADLVVIAGDVFHSVRPSNAAIADAFRQFARLHEALPGTPILITAGNHDSPRAVETGSILTLLEEIPDVIVVDREARVLEFPELDTAVFCVPHNVLAGGGAGALEPTSDLGTHILVMHCTVRGEEVDRMLGYVSEFGGAQIDIEDIRIERWDYVALGHYHLATQLAPNMWYAGAVERTSTNIWIETGPKGFVTFDAETREAVFHSVPTRPIADLPRISARTEDGTYLEPAVLNAIIRERIERVPGGIDGKLVRLVIENLPRELFRDVDHRRLREYRARALHFHLDARRPLARLRTHASPARPPRSIEEETESFLREVWEPTSGDIDVDRLCSLAADYLAQAGEDTAEPLLEPGGAAE